MKTGTLTFHAPNNNGSFLQAYALQQVLKKKGIENRIINFYTYSQEAQYSVIRVPKSIGDVVRNCISLSHFLTLRKRFRRFSEMRQLYLDMTERFTDEVDVYKTLKNYDILICGSDQIWNTSARDFSELYTLNLIDKKKITYAVSCGSHIEEVDSKLITKAAKKFDCISVRESTTKAFFEKKGIGNVTVVLDPTLLLEKDDYKVLYSKTPIINEKYIFLYTINYDQQVLQNVQRIAELLSLPVYAAFTGYSSYKCKKYGIKVLYDIAPDNFLNLMRNATVVCTNSFHGVAFSILFEKKFFRCTTLVESKEAYDDRIDSLLAILGLQKCNINTFSEVVMNDIDYTEVKEKLEELRKKSFSFIVGALMGNT